MSAATQGTKTMLEAIDLEAENARLRATLESMEVEYRYGVDAMTNWTAKPTHRRVVGPWEDLG